MRDIHDFVVPHIVASAPKVVIQEWIEGIPMSVIIREGTQEQRDLMGTRLFELTYDAPKRLEMMHGDAHPGNFMLLPDGKMGVIDFGAVAPMPGGIPVDIGLATRYALEDDYENLQAAMQRIGFIQKGEQVSHREMDEMMKQYVEPLEVEVFHYTRKWLQRITTANMRPDRAAGQIKAARQMDIPREAGDSDAGDRVKRRDLLPARCTHPGQSACHGTDSGIRQRSRLTSRVGKNPAAPTLLPGSLGVLAWPSTRTLACDDRAAVEDLAAPHAPRLLALERGRQALAPDRALRAQRLGAFEFDGALGEPHIGVVQVTGHRQLRLLSACPRMTCPVLCFLVEWLSHLSSDGSVTRD